MQVLCRKNIVDKILMLLLLMLPFFIIGCQAQERFEPLFRCSKRLIEPYGICSHINRIGERNEYESREQDLSMMDSVGVNFVRTDFDWWRMKTQQGGLNYNHFDNMVTSIFNHHKSLLGILTIDERKHVTNEWLNYVTSLSKWYKRDVKFWEMLNEQDLIHRYVPGFTANQYVSFLKDGYQAVKKGNKKAKVLFSGVSNIYSGNLDSVLCQGVDNYFDIMNVHKYTWKNEPESLLDYFGELKKTLAKYEIDKPLWLTETGATTSQGEGVSELAQMERVPRIYLISFAMGVDKVFWYKSRSCELKPKEQEDHFGLWHKDYKPKLAYYAYKTLTKMCPDGSSRPKLERIGNVYIATWKRPDKEKVWALWTSRKKELVKVGVSGNLRIYNMTGAKTDINPNEMEISPSIIYLIGLKKLLIEVL